MWYYDYGDNMEHSRISRLNEVIKILKNSNIIKDQSPTNLCNTIEKLGPTYIKLGQILSTREDIIPVEYCKGLERLRCNVEKIDYDTLLEILNKNYHNKDEIFDNIDYTPIGSASIAEVHLATLKSTKEKVVLKIKRPNIEEIFKEDFSILKRAIDILHINKLIKVINIDEVLEQLFKTCLEETDFIKEGNNLQDFKNNQEKNNYIDCPKYYQEYSTDEIIVMEYIDGYRISQIDKLKEEKYNLEEISKIISENYISQALTDGLFHADPHPDNIIISKDKINYIDLGMIGRLSERNKALLKKCITSILSKNYKEVSRILISMCEIKDEIDYIKIENDIEKILDSYASLGLESINLSSFIKDMFTMLRENHLVLDKDITLLIRGIGIMESVLYILNPKLNLIEVLSLSIKQTALIDTFSKSNLKEISNKVINNTKSIIELPLETSNLLKSLNKGEIKFKVELSDSNKHIDKIENLIHEILLSFIDGCLIIASVFVEERLKPIFYLIIILLSTYIIFKMIIDYFHKGY